MHQNTYSPTELAKLEMFANFLARQNPNRGSKFKNAKITSINTFKK
jgi:hypothetical protein